MSQCSSREEAESIDEQILEFLTKELSLRVNKDDRPVSNERNSEKGLSLARMFVWGKVKNQLAILKYYYKYPVNRENGFGKEFSEKKLQIKHLIDKIRNLSFSSDPEVFR